VPPNGAETKDNRETTAVASRNPELASAQKMPSIPSPPPKVASRASPQRVQIANIPLDERSKTPTHSM
jgi:hypothetical protein